MGEGSPATPGATLTIFAASSLAEVMRKITEEYQAIVPGLEIDLILAGSQESRTQIDHGAQSDIFLSADAKQMALALEAGLVRGRPVEFTSNSLAVIFANSYAPTRDPLNDPDLATLKDLASPGVSLALALPEVPAGAYARDALRDLEEMMGPDSQGYAGNVMANVVTLETNVRGVAMKVALGEVDAGIVYSTDVRPAFVAENTRQIPIPPEADQQATYLAAVLKGSRQPDLADRFARFLISARGQAIFEAYGFGPLPTIGE